MSKKVNEISRIFNINKKDSKSKNDFSEIINIVDKTRIFVVGSSGSGKTTLLNEIKKMPIFRDYKQLPNLRKNEIVINYFKCSIKEALFYLNICALSEPKLYLRKIKHLSVGETFRLRIAILLSRGIKKVIIDEFCSSLDELNSINLSYLLKKLSIKQNLNFIVATVKSELEEFIDPDVKVYINYFGNINISILQTKNFLKHPFIGKMIFKRIRYEEYLKLEKYHYFNSISKETLVERIYNIFGLYYNNEIIGTILYISPYPNNQNYALINNNLSVINRIIIAPQFRGMGLSKLIFEKSLEVLMCKRILVYSALSLYNPFFEHMNFKIINKNNYEKSIENKYLLKKIHFNNLKLKKVLKKVFIKLNNDYDSIIKTIVGEIDCSSLLKENYEKIFETIYSKIDKKILIKQLQYFHMIWYTYEKDK